MVSFSTRELLRAILAIIGTYLLVCLLGQARLKYWRWCAGSPSACYQLSSWSGRPAMPLDGARQLLVLGTLGGGTTATAAGLVSLGLQVKHESSDSLANLCRDGTVSWAHMSRFLDVTTAERDAMVTRLCSKARHHAWSAMMFDGGAFGAGHECTAHSSGDRWWDSCWAAECRRVATREIGCAVRAGGSCTSPFARVLLQVRHPLRTVESNVAAFCRGHDSTGSARRSLQLDTLEVLLGVPPPRPMLSMTPTPSAHSRGAAAGPLLAAGRRLTGQRLAARHVRPSGSPLASPNNGTERAPLDGECSRRFGWFWVRLVRLLLPQVEAIFRVEDTSACAVLRLAGVLPMPSAQTPSALALPRSLVPSDVAMSALAQCKADASRGVNASTTKCDSCSHRQHGTINHKNGAKAGHAAVTLSYRSVHAVDPELSRQLVALAQELGYDLDGDGEG